MDKMLEEMITKGSKEIIAEIMKKRTGIDIFKKKDYPLFLNFKLLDKYEFLELGKTTVIICETNKIVEEISNEFMSLGEENNDVTVAVCKQEPELYKLPEKEWNDFLYHNDDILDNVCTKKQLDEIAINVRDYATQTIIVTTSPEAVYRAIDFRDIWFINEDECVYLSKFKGSKSKFENKEELIKDIRGSRFCDFRQKVVYNKE